MTCTKNVLWALPVRKQSLHVIVVLGGEDQALPAAEGEAGGDFAGGTGCALQEQRHQRLRKESCPQSQPWQQPCPWQPQPETEGAGCQGDLQNVSLILCYFLSVMIRYRLYSTSSNKHLLSSSYSVFVCWCTPSTGSTARWAAVPVRARWAPA